LTFHPDLPSQDQSLGLLARFREAAFDQFDIQAPGLHVPIPYELHSATTNENDNQVRSTGQIK
jgi:hypothetical protein